ncbi:MAG TPA: aspartate kinase [Ferruginibacter sp.]|nr:aspartate kinase [Ferruginibacter sp.]HRO05270.1 aspartate kinase [Ferruginibacter sp.]HRO96033.1 aspartate kinase [Ferruginibacter sp.]HRP48634.1 aspartate kinase [Ferruginibacter sp.]
MLVYKFGGASIQHAERYKNAAQIITQADKPLLVVVSAMGKTTNALEQVAEAFFSGDKNLALERFDLIKQSHIQLAGDLLQQPQAVVEALTPFFTEVEWLLHDKPVRPFDYYYDQIVCCGELLSTTLLHHYLIELKASAEWIDVRDVIRTDNTFRDASIDWTYTSTRIQQEVLNRFQSGTGILITQGFIGATDENESTTLGREGSDYTAAVFAHLMHVDSVTIWKDVEAVMSADPRLYPDSVVIPHLNYLEVIEMAYYGAQVIHPKTIKPLQNKNIPLLVKSFLNPTLPGTRIDADSPGKLPPVIIHKNDQVLIHFQSKDFSFVEGTPAHLLREYFEQHKVKSNIAQHTAISLLCCFDDHPQKIDALAGEAATMFDVTVQRPLRLLTIRHYNQPLLEQLTEGYKIILEQRTTDTVQCVLEEINH